MKIFDFRFSSFAIAAHKNGKSVSTRAESIELTGFIDKQLMNIEVYTYNINLTCDNRYFSDIWYINSDIMSEGQSTDIPIPILNSNPIQLKFEFMINQFG